MPRERRAFFGKPIPMIHQPNHARLRRILANQALDVEAASPVSPQKAAEILRHGTVHGQALTAKQRRLFHGIRAGWKPARLG